MKNKTTAAALAFFLGGFGVHKFYLNDSKNGTLYLILCWTGIPALMALLDFFKLISMSEEEFNRNYNSTFVSGVGLHQGITVNVNYDPVHQRINVPQQSNVAAPRARQDRHRRIPGMSVPQQPNFVVPPSSNHTTQALQPPLTPEEYEFFCFLKSNETILRTLILQYQENKKQLVKSKPSDPVTQPQVSSQTEEKMTVKCSHCGQLYKDIHIQFKGRTVTCKKCRKSFTV